MKIHFLVIYFRELLVKGVSKESKELKETLEIKVKQDHRDYPVMTVPQELPDQLEHKELEDQKELKENVAPRDHKERLVPRERKETEVTKEIKEREETMVPM